MPEYDVTNLESFLGGEYKSSQEEAAESARRAAEEEAGRAYFSTTEELGSLERALRADQPIIEEGILTSIEREKLPIYQGKEESLAELGRGERDLRDATKSAVSTAGRTFNELATMIPRYAGTSVGGAVGEILGRQTARDISSAKRAEQKGIFDIGQERNRVIRFASDKVAAVEATGQNLIRQSKQNFLNAIDKINTLRRVAENDKKSLRLQALYKYQGDVKNIASEIQAQKFNLQKWAYQKNQELRIAEENRARAAQEQGFDLSDLLGQGGDVSVQGASTTPAGPQSTPARGGLVEDVDGLSYVSQGGQWVPQENNYQSQVLAPLSNLIWGEGF